MRKWIQPMLVTGLAAAMGICSLSLAQQPAPAQEADAQRRAEIEARLMAAQDRMQGVFAPAADGAAQRFWVNRAGKKEKATFLGVVAVQADAAMRAQLKLPRGIGLVIHSVQEGTPAAAAGLQENDLITKIDDQWLVTPQQLGVLVRMHKADDEVTLTGLRAGEAITLKAKLVEKEMVIPDNDGQADGGMNWAVQGVPVDAFRFNGFVTDGEDASLIINNNNQTLKVSIKENQRHLVATDDNGQVLFDGPVETDEQRNALPADLAEVIAKYRTQFDAVKDAPAGERKITIIKDR